MPTWTETGLERTWRALASNEDSGWRLHALQEYPHVSFLAGRSCPGNREAILLVLPSDIDMTDVKFPKSIGFEVIATHEPGIPEASIAIALVRSPVGELDIFKVMAIDLLRVTESHPGSSPKRMLERFGKRLWEWQAFMANDRKKPLSVEKQVGLYGELVVLEKLADDCGCMRTAIGMWQGPYGAAQDFHVNNGAIEVKSTRAKSGFSAKINSIEQLDTVRTPLYLCALRFSQDDEGISLKDFVARIKEKADAANVSMQLQALLFTSHYLDEHDAAYGDPLVSSEERCFLVDESFPALWRTSLPIQIKKAVYDLDLDILKESNCSLTETTSVLLV